MLVLFFFFIISCSVLEDVLLNSQPQETSAATNTSTTPEVSSQASSQDEEDLEVTQVVSEAAESTEDASDVPLAPDFELMDLDGQLVSLESFRGQPVMINFWATWCPPCRSEMPIIQAAGDQFADDLVILAISTGDRESDVIQYQEAHDLDLIILLDPEAAVAESYGVRGLPTSVFIDSSGKLRDVYIGELSEDLLMDYLIKIGVQE